MDEGEKLYLYKLDELRSQVFGNDLLREKIIGYVISGNGMFSTYNTKNIRLVQKSWSRSVTKCVRKEKKPLFHLPVESTSFKWKRSYSKFKKREDQVPTTALNIGSKFFTKKALINITGLLRYFGSSLVSLSIQIPTNVHPHAADMSELLLPFLQNLKIDLQDPDNWTPGVNAEQMFPPPEAGNDNVITFLQAVLSACQQLKCFTFEGFNYDDLPSGYDKLVVPPTLTNLSLNRELNDSNLLNLIAPPLPKVSVFKLTFPFQKFGDNTVFTVLNKFRDTLTNLTLGGFSDEMFSQVTMIKFPEMKSLKTLNVHTDNVNWCPNDSGTLLQDKLPLLETVNFVSQNPATLPKWIKTVRLLSVNKVYLELEDPWDSNRDESRNLAKSIQLLANSFPNVRTLHLDFRTVHGFTGLREHAVSADCWTSLFLGISGSMAASIRTADEFKDICMRPNRRYPSILDMTELKEIHLMDETYANSPFLFDDIFRLGFMSLSKLKHVCLVGGFEVSMENAEKWRESGRKLEVRNFFSILQSRSSR